MVPEAEIGQIGFEDTRRSRKPGNASDLSKLERHGMGCSLDLPEGSRRNRP